MDITLFNLELSHISMFVSIIQTPCMVLSVKGVDWNLSNT